MATGVALGRNRLQRLECDGHNCAEHWIIDGVRGVGDVLRLVRVTLIAITFTINVLSF